MRATTTPSTAFRESLPGLAILSIVASTVRLTGLLALAVILILVLLPAAIVAAAGLA
jgi:hypothetical protein